MDKNITVAEINLYHIFKIKFCDDLLHKDCLHIEFSVFVNLYILYTHSTSIFLEYFLHLSDYWAELKMQEDETGAGN